MSADGRAETAPEVFRDPAAPPRGEESMPPMSVLLAAGAAAEAVCTPPSPPEPDADPQDGPDPERPSRQRDAA
ncbi:MULTISPECIES: hypothetical protein [Streptomycetaceae]|uniref:Uncharacterized protein n=1 Tax=Streptantibioticus cattleyicolor (strain ATCC 35852 / DSM 46488 / JCM 4925 / NBRC 14057 / NRRL 8057) TaxID=1003195 RepID=F8JZB9_STREN|nr:MULTISPECIES: hypothetical protein [Streptomycetaceae]AEW96001.1 hypothetical protein SCATT_36300 [Streptantibioticus cattleyicolor NRRL 8057 = DSM 46488]MYS60533.1 hypothetical protein [Streptomyces sp. SID5468]CCB76332.1 protein of unknown function [Streptantibioticus cattleyicolor NRRL 8057 = DSM 46488]